MPDCLRLIWRLKKGWIVVDGRHQVTHCKAGQRLTFGREEQEIDAKKLNKHGIVTCSLHSVTRLNSLGHAGQSTPIPQ